MPAPGTGVKHINQCLSYFDVVMYSSLTVRRNSFHSSSPIEMTLNSIFFLFISYQEAPTLSLPWCAFGVALGFPFCPSIVDYTVHQAVSPHACTSTILAPPRETTAEIKVQEWKRGKESPRKQAASSRKCL